MNGKWHIWIVVILAVLAVSFVSCRPKGILSSRKMKDVMIDLHKMDGMIEAAHMEYGYDEAKALYYAQVLEKHGITQAQFDSSLVWYTANPALFDKIYPKVVEALKNDIAAYEQLHADELNLNPDTVGGEGLEDERVSGLEITPKQFDSILWVTQHGYPSHWNPLVQDTVYQFFPQVSILR